MSSALDMSLDDIIKNNKKSGSGGSSRGRGRGGSGAGAGAGAGPGPTRRGFQNRGANRSTPYTTASKAPEAAWKHDMFVDQAMAFPAQAGARASSIETGTKLYISNLEYGVSNEDIKELFSEVGDLKRNTIHYDRSGRSKGTAEVVFSRRSDAIAAVKRYNNVQLDGKPMKIEIVGTNIVTPSAPTPATNGAFGNTNGIPRSGRGGALGRIRGGGSGGGGGGGGGRGRGSGRGRGRGRGRDEKISPEDLDADLEKYHSESMQTN